MVPDNVLVLDRENAHVDHRELYHSLSPSFRTSLASTLVGQAADGFEIHYHSQKVNSSWKLKTGTRLTSPYGSYDGTYNQDYEYIEGLGELDECNGKICNNRHAYFAINDYPFSPRCFYGIVSISFINK